MQVKSSRTRPIETIFVVLALVAYTGAFVRVFVSRSYGLTVVNENNIYMQAFFAITYLVAALYLFQRPQIFLFSTRKTFIIWLLVLWTFVSVTWSYAPDITFRRSVALIGTTLFAIYLANRFSLDQNFIFLGISFSLVMLASYIFTFFFPTDLGWTGVFLTKNELTRTSLLAAMVFVYLLRTTKRVFWFVSLLAALILMYKSSSATGIILTIMGLGIIMLFFLLRHFPKNKKHNAIVLFGIMTIFVSASIVLNWENLLSFLQRDATLTGRILLWNLVWWAIQKNPVLGYGYGGFWNGWEGPSAVIWDTLHWFPPHAHNGFLDIALDLGLMGVFFYILVYGSFILSLFRDRQQSISYSVIMSLFTGFMLFYNLVENIALSRNSITWLLLVLFFSQNLIRSEAPNYHGFITKLSSCSRLAGLPKQNAEPL
jgi:O-antigen ligase